MGLLTLTLLGGFQARLDAGQILTLPTKKTEALLAYLALRPGQAYSRGRLATLLWGSTRDEQARTGLRQALYILRKTLPAMGPPSLLLEGGAIALNPAAVEVDAAVFERLLAEGTLEALERAVALYRGDLLDGLSLNEAPFEEWLIAERERLRELALEAFAKLLAYQSKAGQTERAIHTGVRLLAFDPSQEVVHRVLIRLYARQGRRSAALKQYQVCVAALQRELRTEPEPETKQLYLDILHRRTLEPLKVDTQEPGHSREVRHAPQECHPEPITRDALLIGRDSEITRLREALDQASRGCGHVVAIVGEAGIGKSSVLMALAAEARARGTRILLGRAYQTEQVLAFGPWVDALRSGHLAADVEVLDSLTPLSRAELARLLPELGGAGGEPGCAPPDHRRLFESVAELVRGLAAKESVLIMLEDIHWSDEMSGRLVAFLARRISTSRVLIVVTMRDEELASAPIFGHVLDELDAEPHFVQLALAPLTRADTTALVQLLTRGTFPAGDFARLDEQIWNASAGNPFMVVETIRAVQEGNSPHTIAELPFPKRARGVITGRLQRLSDRGRHLASVAAVIGREFDFALLQHAAGLDEPEAADGVEELVRRRVLKGVGERFDFVHERIREVVHNQLLQPRRRALHVLVAKALEEIYAGHLEPHYAALAGHYRAGEVWEKALTYFRQAGAGALRLSAYREAVACFEQSLEVLSRLPETRETLEAAIDLRFDLRNALLPVAEPEKIRGYLQDAEALARALDDRRRLDRVSAYMSHYFRMADQSTEAIKSKSHRR